MKEEKIAYKVKRVILTVIILFLLSIFILPFVFMVTSSFKQPQQLLKYPPEFIPAPFTFRSYIYGFNAFPFISYILNSFKVTFASIIGNLLSCTLVAYGFARFKTRLRNFLFVVLLSTMMIPWIVTFVPMYVGYSKIGFLNTYLPLVLPYFLAGNAFSVFLFCQFFKSIPVELDAAAKIDGCGPFSILYRIILPNSKSVILIASIFVFVNTWNDFFTPLIFLNDQKLYTMAIGLAIWNSFANSGGTSGRLLDYGPLMAMATVSIIPVVTLYIISQKYFVQGIVTTGLKG